MRIGKLDRIIYIVSDTATGRDATGGVTVTTTSTKTWASINYLNTGFERDDAEKIDAIIHVEFIIRKRSVTERDRITYNLETFDIYRVSELNDRYLKLTAKKII
jgi:head-tail adaptor